jgi:hypothetical protein
MIKEALRFLKENRNIIERLGRNNGDALGPGGKCVCRCGHEEDHEIGEPCIHKKCPVCGKKMKRKTE